MVLDHATTHKSRLSSNVKRFFVTVLLFNFLLACVFYIHGNKVPDTQENAQVYHQTLDMKLDADQSLALMRNILEHEYDHDNLQAFYRTTKTAFALGLRCPTDMPQADTTSNFNVARVARKKRDLMNAMSRSLTMITAPAKYLPAPRLHRTFYPFTIHNTDACSTSPLDLLIIVISKSDNFKTRDAIRRTWGSRKSLGPYSNISIKLLFLIDIDEKLDQSIRLENRLFEDIIQVELPQQYTLVTHRELALWEWSFRFCRSAKFLFKTDDDIFINLIALLKFMSPLLKGPSDRSFRVSDMALYGYKHPAAGVFRTANDSVEVRYVVTREEYPCDIFPDFLSGFGYLIPKKARDALVYASFMDPNEPFRLSDVYVTGILPNYLSLARQSMADYRIRYAGSCDDFFNNSISFACASDSHYGNAKDVFYSYYRYWQRVKQFM